METLADFEKGRVWCKKLGSKWSFFIVPRVGNSGGLAFLWDDSLSTKILYVNN